VFDQGTLMKNGDFFDSLCMWCTICVVLQHNLADICLSAEETEISAAMWVHVARKEFTLFLLLST